MTPKLYWQLYDACVKRMAKRMRITPDRVRELALRKMTERTVNDPHKWLQTIWKRWKVEQRYPARFTHFH